MEGQDGSKQIGNSNLLRRRSRGRASDWFDEEVPSGSAQHSRGKEPAVKSPVQHSNDQPLPSASIQSANNETTDLSNVSGGGQRSSETSAGQFEGSRRTSTEDDSYEVRWGGLELSDLIRNELPSKRVPEVPHSRSSSRWGVAEHETNSPGARKSQNGSTGSWLPIDDDLSWTDTRKTETSGNALFEDIGVGVAPYEKQVPDSEARRHSRSSVEERERTMMRAFECFASHVVGTSYLTVQREIAKTEFKKQHDDLKRLKTDERFSQMVEQQQQTRAAAERKFNEMDHKLKRHTEGREKAFRYVTSTILSQSNKDESRIQSLETRCGHLQARVREFDSLRSQVGAYMAEAIHLKSQLSGIQAMLNSSNDENKNLTRRIIEAESQLHNLPDLPPDLVKVKASVDHHTTELKQLNESISQLRTDMATQDTVLQEMQDNSDKFVEALNKADEDMKAFDTELNTMDARLTVIEKANTPNANATDAEGSMAVAKTTVDRAHATSAMAQPNDLEDLRNSLSSLQLSQASRDELITEELENTYRLINTIRDDIEGLRQRVNNVEVLGQGLNGSIDAAHGQTVQQLREQYEALRFSVNHLAQMGAQNTQTGNEHHIVQPNIPAARPDQSLVSSTYTRVEIDNMLEGVRSSARNQNQAYSRAEVDTMIEGIKATTDAQGEPYSRAEVDAMIQGVRSAQSQDQPYSKAESDGRIQALRDYIETSIGPESQIQIAIQTMRAELTRLAEESRRQGVVVTEMEFQYDIQLTFVSRQHGHKFHKINEICEKLKELHSTLVDRGLIPALPAPPEPLPEDTCRAMVEREQAEPAATAATEAPTTATASTRHSAAPTNVDAAAATPTSLDVKREQSVSETSLPPTKRQRRKRRRVILSSESSLSRDD